MNKRLSTPQPKVNLFRVIGADDSIYLSREQKYLKHGQQIALTPQEAELLLAAGLVEKVSLPELPKDEKAEEI